MSLHTWCHQAPCKPSSCAIFMLSSHWGRAAAGKKCLASMCAGSRRSCLTLCDPVDCGLPGFSVREGVSPGKNTGAYWTILVSIPFWSTIFPTALATNTFEYLVLAETLRPNQLHHLHTWPSQGKFKTFRGASGARRQWTTHMQRWK